MKGKVRSHEVRCPEGHGALVTERKEGEDIAIRCTVCNYRPKTFFVDLYYQGRHRISRGRDGDVLSSFRQAHRLLENIRSDMDAHTFALSNYIQSEIDQFRGKNMLPKWINTKGSIAPTTMREYERYVRLYFTPFFGALDLRSLKSGTVEDFLQWIPERQKQLGYKNLAEKTVKNIATTLRNFCTWLYRREVISRIPDFPVFNLAEPVIQCISRDSQVAVLDHISPRHRPVFEFLVYHPVRPGEARALRLKHFNLDEMTVHIAEAWSLDQLRTRKNKRDYYLPISQHFDVSVLQSKLPEAFIFCNVTGRSYTQENLRRIWHRACKKAGVPRIKLYNGTRHSTATDTLRKTGSLDLVRMVLGHSDRKMTQKYAKMNVEILRGLTDNVTKLDNTNRATTGQTKEARG